MCNNWAMYNTSFLLIGILPFLSNSNVWGDGEKTKAYKNILEALCNVMTSVLKHLYVLISVGFVYCMM